MVAEPGEHIESAEPFWPDELRENRVIYRFRVSLMPIKISKCFLDNNICTTEVKPPKNCFIKIRDLQRLIAEKCGIKLRGATIPLGANVSPITNKCKAQEILKHLMESSLFDYFFDYLMIKLLGELESSDNSAFIILLNLFSGKNVLLVGPPGSGKTSLLKNLLENLGISYRLETGNPEWTPFDTIGGPLANGGVKKGFIFRVVEESKSNLEKERKLYWLIIDEINRANVDLAFGKFFTLLDPIHRRKEKLEILQVEGDRSSKYEVEIPYSFRVLATMNNYDRALLFKLGYALTRRFAIINHIYLQTLPNYFKQYINAATKQQTLKTLTKSSEAGGEEINVNFSRIREELLKCKEDRPYDCIAPLDFVTRIKKYSKDEWRDKVFAIEVLRNRIKLENVLINLVEEINNELGKFKDCEVCPIQVTPGIVADALKYIAAGIYAYKTGLVRLPCKVEEDTNENLAFILLLLDSAFSTYIIQQLDILADYANREKLYRGATWTHRHSKESSVIDILDKISKILNDIGLIYSAKLVEKIKKGYHVF